MKKTLIILVLIFTLFGCERNYIKDFKIEGIALGDSLLDNLQKKKYWKINEIFIQKLNLFLPCFYLQIQLLNTNGFQ